METSVDNLRLILGLKLKNLRQERGASLKEITLSVRRGEILGIGGVAGNGQDELLAALSGEVRVAPEAVRLAGRPVGRLGPGARRRLGLLTAPEEHDPALLAKLDAVAGRVLKAK